MCMGRRHDENEEKYITTPKAAKLFGLERQYAARLAKEAIKRGDPFPVKRGRAYEAPPSEWDKILNPTDKVKRKARKNRIKNTVIGSQQDKSNEMSCSKAARKYGISPSWAARLSKRAQKRGDEWPIWEGGQLIAPYPEWVKLFQDQSLRLKKYR